MKIGLKLGRGLVVKGRVFAVMVVVGIDVIEDFSASVVGVDETAALEHFGFECSYERLTPSVVIGVGPCGHALANSGMVEDLAVGSASVLAAAVAMEDDACGRVA